MINLDTATEMNLLATNNFKFDIMEMPTVAMFAQKFDVPGVALGRAIQPTPLVDISIPGDTIQFEDLQITFLVDENMKNWKEVWAWMMHLGGPRSTKQYKRLVEENTQYSRTSDIAVHVLSNKFNSLNVMVFVDCFPVYLSGVAFSNNEMELVHPEATVTFDYAYSYFTPDETLPNETF